MGHNVHGITGYCTKSQLASTKCSEHSQRPQRYAADHYSSPVFLC